MTQLSEIVAALRAAGQLVRAPSSLPEITGITADTRHLAPGTLFCAVRGSAEGIRITPLDAADDDILLRGVAEALGRN